jgi:hypothetical protein
MYQKPYGKDIELMGPDKTTITADTDLVVYDPEGDTENGDILESLGGPVRYFAILNGITFTTDETYSVELHVYDGTTWKLRRSFQFYENDCILSRGKRQIEAFIEDSIKKEIYPKTKIVLNVGGTAPSVELAKAGVN